MPRRLAAGAGLAAACAGGLAMALGASTACVPHQCDPTSSTITLSCPSTDGGAACANAVNAQGEVTLTSGAFDGAWMAFPGNLTITVNLPAGFVAKYPPDVWVSTGQYQDAGATSTQASGQLVEISDWTDTSFKLNNGTCADYDVWFEVIAVQTTSDGGAGRDASAE